MARNLWVARGAKSFVGIDSSCGRARGCRLWQDCRLMTLEGR